MRDFNLVSGNPAPMPPPLPVEDEIIARWGAGAAPLVSICCATYNHVLYLQDALQGFLAQETHFPFEIIIRDDASTDGTVDIAREFAAKYPRIIRTIFERENQYSRGVRPNPAMVPHARGSYIALCEGDDYWIVTDKLEKQVALLNKCANCSMCVAQTVVCKYENNNSVCERILGTEKDYLDFEDIKRTYVHTSTYLIRTDFYKKALDQYAGKIGFSDTALRYILADIGPFVQLKEIVSVYRVTGGGLWTSLERTKQVEWEIELAESFYANFNPKYRTYFSGKLYQLYRLILQSGVYSFNQKGALKNYLRYLHFALKFWAKTIFLKLLSYIK
ncbi:glycosyltransferase [Ferrigenium sp. UT5]|uniref:glycosyltransferase n=1 Tax=Ferrigenium sp. UT5 TaxID=3242105 RepID=UPI003551D5DA